MQCLIVIALASMAAAAPEGLLHRYHFEEQGYHGPQAIPTVLPNGHIADTPEVAAAKLAHYAEHTKALSHASHEEASVSHYDAPESHYYAPAPVHEYITEPVAHEQYHYTGPELSFSHEYAPHYQYQGPLAIPKVLPSGYLADTPEVAAARHAHLSEHARLSHQSHYAYHY